MATECEHNDTIIELTGVSGRNGRVGNLEKRMDRLENMALKLMASTFAGGGLVAAVVKMLG